MIYARFLGYDPQRCGEIGARLLSEADVSRSKDSCNAKCYVTIRAILGGINNQWARILPQPPSHRNHRSKLPPRMEHKSPLQMIYYQRLYATGSSSAADKGNGDVQENLVFLQYSKSTVTSQRGTAYSTVQ